MEERKMIIDAHNHPDWHKHDFEKFIANMDQNGIDKTWLLSWETPYGDYDPETAYVLPSGILHGERSVPIPFSHCLAYKRRAPERFVLGYAPDPHRPDATLALRSAVDLYGVQVCGEVKFRLMYDDPDCIDLFRAAGKTGAHGIQKKFIVKANEHFISLYLTEDLFVYLSVCRNAFYLQGIGKDIETNGTLGSFINDKSASLKAAYGRR
jgi:hypothetical protein